MSGETILDDVTEFVQRFVAYPSSSAVVAHVLWIAHTHLVECFDNTPRLAALSPEPGSGKSRLLEITEGLVPRPVLTVNSTPSYVFRKISSDDAGLPTLLFDEVDALFGGRPSESSEDLRGLLNSGYRKGATAGRAVVRGKEVLTEDWPSFAPVAMAGLNQLPDTLMTRSIVIRMRRRKPTERVLPYRRRQYQPEALALCERLAAWAVTAVTEVTDVWPVLPVGIEDRDADIWEPLISIADAAGGKWPDLARTAAVTLVNESKDRPATLGIRLLADVKKIMEGTDRISSMELVDRLCALESAPWSSIKGAPIDSRFLSRMFDKYEIDRLEVPRTFKIDGKAVKGYTRQHFADAWARYVPEPSPEVGNLGNPGNPVLVELEQS